MRSTDGFQNIMGTFFGSRSISGKNFYDDAISSY